MGGREAKRRGVAVAQLSRAALLAVLVAAPIACAVGPDTELTSATEGGGADDSDPGGAPVLSSLVVTPSERNHLAVSVYFETDTETVGEVEVSDGDGVRWVAGGLAADAGTRHEVEVIGLRAAVRYTLTARARDVDGRVGALETSHRPDPLPEDLPAIIATGMVPEGQPGWTFFSISRRVGAEEDPSWGYVVAVDRRGRVVWYRAVPGVGDLQLTPEGDPVALAAGSGAIIELDLFGRRRARWRAEGLDPPQAALHDALRPRPEDEGYWTLGLELREIGGYLDAGGGPVSYPVVGDTLLAVARDGTVTRAWSLLDALDPEDRYRTGPGFDDPTYDPFFPESVGTRDWSHVTSITVDTAGDQLVLAARNLGWVVALDRGTGEMGWRLGPEGDFALTEGAWFCRPLDAVFEAGGSLLVLDGDDGCRDAGLGVEGAPGRVRVSRYQLDPHTRQAAERWTWRADPQQPVLRLGALEPLSKGALLITHGAATDPNSGAGPSIVELDTSLERVVFELRVGGSDDEAAYTLHRALRRAGPG